MSKWLALAFSVGLWVPFDCGPPRRAAVDRDTGNLVAFWLEYPERVEPVLVTEPYAVLIVWLGAERRFTVYDNKAKQVHKAPDFESFLREVRQLPRGVAVQRFDTCTVPRTHDMPEEARQRLEEAMRAGDRTWAVSPVTGLTREIICTCETRGLRFP
jgi:hypothetical protein